MLFVVFIIVFFVFFMVCINKTTEYYENSDNTNIFLVKGKKRMKLDSIPQSNDYKAYPYQKDIHTTNFKDCLRNGFCNGLFKSTIPKGYSEYPIQNYSHKESNQRLSSLNELAHKNANLSVGDKNYTYQPPPKQVTFQ